MVLRVLLVMSLMFLMNCPNKFFVAMKKIYSYVMLAAVAAAALVSCAKEMDKVQENIQPKGNIQIAVVADSPVTKTELTDATHVGWSAGDKIDFVNSAAGEKVQSGEASISAGKATFTATVANAGTFFAYYPTSDSDLTGGHGQVTVPSVQTPTNVDTFDPKADVMVSTTFAVGAAGSYDTDPASIQFKRLGAFLDVYFVDNTTGSKLAGESATSIAVESSGTGKVQLTGTLEISEDGIESSTGASYKVTANYADFDIDADHAHIGIIPCTLASGSDLVITAETDKYTITKTIPISSVVDIKSGRVQPIKVKVGNSDIEHKIKVERLWGYYPNTGWPTSFMGANADRGVATDGEYVFIPNANSSTAEVVAIKISDQSTTAVNMTGVDGGYFKTACARTIYNPATDKYILLVCSLAYESDGNFNVYAWVDGIASAPTKIISWNTDNGSGVRRVGDLFTVSGDWSNGEIWARINKESTATTFVWKITDGVVAGPLGGTIGYGGSAGMGSVYKYSIDAPHVMVVTTAIGRFFSCTVESTWINADSAGINWTSGDDNSVWAKNYGFTPFEFNGRKYIAYHHVVNAARGWLTIINDTQGTASGFMQTLIDQSIVFQGAVQIGSDTPSMDVVTGATYSMHAIGSCSVAFVDDYVILVGHQQNTGLAVFKMSLK